MKLPTDRDHNVMRRHQVERVATMLLPPSPACDRVMASGDDPSCACLKKRRVLARSCSKSCPSLCFVNKSFASVSVLHIQASATPISYPPSEFGTPASSQSRQPSLRPLTRDRISKDSPRQDVPETFDHLPRRHSFSNHDSRPDIDLVLPPNNIPA